MVLSLNCYASDAKFSNESIDVFGADFLDENIRGEIAAPHDHQASELTDAFGFTPTLIKCGFRIIVYIQRKLASIRDAGERIDNLESIVQRK